MKKTGIKVVVSYKNGALLYVRHNGSFTDNMLLAKQFGSIEEAAAYARNENRGKTEDEIRTSGLHAVEVVLKEIEITNE